MKISDPYCDCTGDKGTSTFYSVHPTDLRPFIETKLHMVSSSHVAELIE